MATTASAMLEESKAYLQHKLGEGASAQWQACLWGHEVRPLAQSPPEHRGLTDGILQAREGVGSRKAGGLIPATNTERHGGDSGELRKQLHERALSRWVEGLPSIAYKPNKPQCSRFRFSEMVSPFASVEHGVVQRGVEGGVHEERPANRVRLLWQLEVKRLPQRRATRSRRCRQEHLLHARQVLTVFFSCAALG